MGNYSGKTRGFWTDERVAELRSMLAGKRPTGQIAVYFGVSRNSIIGKASRLGVALPEASMASAQRGAATRAANRGRPAGTAIDPTPRQPPTLGLGSSSLAGLDKPITSKRANLIKAFGEIGPTPAQPTAFIVGRSPVADAAPAEGVAYLDLRAHHCRAPMPGRDCSGLMLSCGRPVREASFVHNGKVVECSYCPQHAARFFTGRA